MILPMIDVPVSLVGTFAVMALLGFSLNNLTLFGLVLAIGIVVDDAIVVLENIERHIAEGLDARAATIKAMGEITGPILAITLVLISVFLPAAFLPGLVGQFYRQFALTIAVGDGDFRGQRHDADPVARRDHLQDGADRRGRSRDAARGTAVVVLRVVRGRGHGLAGQALRLPRCWGCRRPTPRSSSWPRNGCSTPPPGCLSCPGRSPAGCSAGSSSGRSISCWARSSGASTGSSTGSRSCTAGRLAACCA